MTDHPTTFQTRDWGWLIALALPLIGILPAFTDGIMAAADAPLHTHRIYAMGTLLASGELYPRWVPWFHLGYGYPIFNFYPPGVFYIGGLLMQLGVSAVTAFHLVAAFAWIFGTLGTYRLARTFLPGYAALLAAALWAYAPSRLFEVWTQGSLPQMMAAALVPWVFWTITRGALAPSRRRAVWIGLSVAGLVFTHQPITFITALFVAPFTAILIVWLSRTDWRSPWPRAACVYGGVLLAAGLSLIFLLPLALELQYVEAVNGRDDVVRYLVSNFLRLGEVFSHPMPNDLTDMRVEYPMTLGLLGTVLFGFGVVALVRVKRYALALLLLVAFGFAVFMMVRQSLPVWLALPFFRQLRFPARVLRIAAVILAVGGAASVLLLPQRFRHVTVGLLIVVIIATSLPFVYPSQPILDYSDQSATTEIQFELDTYTWGTTSYNEFNPRWGSRPPYDRPPELDEYATNPLQLYPQDRVDGFELLTTNAFTITTPEARPIRVRQFYYPGWYVTLNGERVETYPGEDIGLITVDVPAGTSRIEARYNGTMAQRIGTAISLASALIALGLIQTGTHVTSNTQAERLTARSSVVASAVIVAIALVNWIFITPNTDWFRLRSQPDAPPYMQTAQYAEFGGDIALMGYTLTETAIADGEVMPLTLYWRPLRDLTDTHYRPVVQIVNMTVTEQWAVSQPFFPGGGFTSTYTADRYTSDPHDLTLFDYAEPYAARILVQMFDARTDEPLTLPDGSDRLLLDDIIYVDKPSVEAVQTLDAAFGESFALWCSTIERDADQIDITLYWHVTQAPDSDYTTFVHGLDAEGEIVQQADAPPILEYPTSYWREGQTLAANYTLPTDDAITEIAVGLYNDAGRLPAFDGDTPLADDRAILSLNPANCIQGDS